MKLSVHYQDGCASLTLDYSVPVRDDTYCMCLHRNWERQAPSLTSIIDIGGAGESLPSLLTFETGDKIDVLNGRTLTVKESFSLPVPLGSHEHLVFEVVTYYFAGLCLDYRDKDPEFITVFERVFALSGPLSIRREELTGNEVLKELYGDNAGDYFCLDSEFREIFIKSVGGIID